MIKLFGGVGLYLYLRPKIHRISPQVPKRIKGGVLIASNHTSLYDPLVLFCVFWYRRLYFPATKELFAKPINKFFFKNMNCIMIDRDTLNTSAVKTMCARLKEGNAIAIFPEGRISTSGVLLDFKDGTAFMARRCSKPVLPVYIAPRENKRQRIHVIIGEPIDVSELCINYSKDECIAVITEELRLAEERLEEYYLTEIKGESRCEVAV